jgi:hypothetical protein
VDFERIAVDARGLAQFFDGEVDLIRDEEVEAEDLVVRITRAAAVDPPAVPQLVSLPCLADGEAEQQHDEGNEKRKRVAEVH